MSSWFHKVFGRDRAQPAQGGAVAFESRTSGGTLPQYGEPFESETGRRIVYAEVLPEDTAPSAWTDEIRIKARPERDGIHCTYLVDRPLCAGYSAWFPSKESAAGCSPLAEALFEIPGVGSVLLHNTTLTVASAPCATPEHEARMRAAGACIRAVLQRGEPVLTRAYIEAIPSPDAIRARLQAALDDEINPGIAAHLGVITLDRVDGNTVYITMGGGCQGCAASQITLKEGIRRVFRERVPQVGAIVDVTDHSAGRNPYYREVPGEQ